MLCVYKREFLLVDAGFYRISPSGKITGTGCHEVSLHHSSEALLAYMFS